MTRKRDALLTIAGIIVLFGLAFFVQEEMDRRKWTLISAE